jgi:hypothetical protein
MLVESAGRRDCVSLTPVLEAEMVGTLRLATETSGGSISAVWTSIASIMASALVAATHSADPKDPGVVSPTVNRAAPPEGRPGGACVCSITGPE